MPVCRAYLGTISLAVTKDGLQYFSHAGYGLQLKVQSRRNRLEFDGTACTITGMRTCLIPICNG